MKREKKRDIEVRLRLHELLDRMLDSGEECSVLSVANMLDDFKIERTDYRLSVKLLKRTCEE